MSDILSIPSVETEDGVVQYLIQLKVPLRQINVNRRYSEFQQLLEQLSSEAGIKSSDFPYKLPPKRWIKLNTELLIEERRRELAQFLNLLIRDPEFQNNDHVRSFLRLPQSFRFTAAVFKQQNREGNNNDIVDLNSINIDSSVWLEVVRLTDSRIRTIGNELKTSTDTLYTISIRQEMMRLIRPTIEKLQKTLVEKELSSNEYRRRKALLTRLQESVQLLSEDLNKSFQPQQPLQKDLNDRHTLLLSGSRPGGRRVLGGPIEETKQTMALNSQELLQLQKQIQNNQDQEVLQLRGAIARQKQISTAIYNEVEEQNQLLDMLHSDLDVSSDKLAKARAKARNIL
ncbi:uncharacterized protein KQ657_004768 [Scheffersomyces spartinae]|uniref:Sorting nexin MVP1 n=1 Tax=Scheffersomyces spartinae TaxID=45513 RepID=A0A9P7VB51_9ASCO|nr:uncharacterized protein KQ657_004768 [Scheffersomyces spartinae]KAG7194553.1 hypothetical protein KQ657_004768 [Scheffersomyces spartinae]